MPARSEKKAVVSTPDPLSATPTPPPASSEAPTSEGEAALGPGKRHRRPSTMYKPPEALTAEAKRSHTASPSMSSAAASSPCGSATSVKPKGPKARSKSPTVLPTHVKKEASANDMRTPTKITLRVPPRSVPPPARVDEMHTPATFTRRGERMSEPQRRRHILSSTTSQGMLSPKPVRTATGVWRMSVSALPEQEEDASSSDDDSDDDVDEVDHGMAEVARDAMHMQLAAQAWSLALERSPVPSTMPTEPEGGESEGEEEDFHQAMLRDDELDLLVRTTSPQSSDSDAVWTDGHVTTPASYGTKESPVSEMRSCSPQPVSMTPQESTVFAHALPVPHANPAEGGAHAGLLTLSLPFEMRAPTSAAAGPMPMHETGGRSSPMLDTDGDTPLTPIHTVSVADRENGMGTGSEETRSLGSLPEPTLPSDLLHATVASPSSPVPAPESDVVTMPVVDMASSPDAPLLDATEFAVDDDAGSTPHSPVHLPPQPAAWLHSEPAMHPTPLDDADMDTYFDAPEKIIALTDLDRAWALVHGSSESTTTTSSHHSHDMPPSQKAEDRSPPRLAPRTKRPRVSDSTCVRQPRTRSSRLQRRAA
ncbi:hypothetical protein Malapachy_3159 [Malassezia pachydermatis]|uniref:Uncharacterized protein n=1 Tax=Malassezia pachydermatis TaxID=77020 RepID=A0A0N0RSR2_9BASI|nr:hypothetical protein Malapachy_3159 [Malassezia pachydermatis]KOS16195.1 hypothetical protein Malapachy_3159 [Malassezia pachydermatis]